MSKERGSFEEALFIISPIEPQTVSKTTIRVGGPCTDEKREYAKRLLTPAGYRAWLKSDEAKGLVAESDLECEEIGGVLHGTEPERLARALASIVESRKARSEKAKELTGGKKGAANGLAPMADRVQAAAEAWWKRNHKLSVRDVARKLADGEKADGRRVKSELFGGFETIRKKIKKPISG